MNEEDKITNDKAVQFYSAKVNAWFSTKLEYDKSLLLLSSGAIGLLITLLTTVGVESLTLLIIFIVAIISFIVCLFATIGIFNRNAKHLEDLMQGKDTNDTVLSVLDTMTITSFILGVILTSIIGISIATNKVLAKEIKMTDKKVTIHKKEILNESFNNAKNMSPKSSDLISKSFNNAKNLDPKPCGGKTSTSDSNSSTSGSSGQSKSNNSSSSNDKKT